MDPIPADVAAILLVEDEPAVRGLFALSLRKEGYHVMEASNGAEALAVVEQSGRVDLVVTDVAMPLLDGFQLAAELRRDERTRAIPFIFHSGDTTADNEARARRLGAIAYLAKPLDPAVLAALVAGALARA